MNKNFPFFSIIIPTFNSEKVLSTCLNSIAQQSFKRVEVIIQDGESTDRTIEIIKAFSKVYNKVKWESIKDNGVYDAMNKGIDKATGEWIYFLGSDDCFYHNDVLKEVFEHVLKKDFNVIYGNVEIIGDAPWANNHDKYDGEFDLGKLFQKNICHQSIFYRKSFVSKIGYYNIKYKTCADWDYNLKCWAITDFFYLDKIIARFNAGGVSTIESIDNAFFNDILRNIISYFNLSAFDPLLGKQTYVFADQVIALQKEENYKKYFTIRLINFIKRRFNNILKVVRD